MNVIIKPSTAIRDQVSEEEWALRVDLAAAYRLVAMYGWDDLVFTHISVRLPGPARHKVSPKTDTSGNASPPTPPAPASLREDTVSASDHHFLINPYGWMFDEITASSLVKVDIHGNKVMDSPYPVNPAGFTIHSAVHAAREVVACVVHTQSINGVAVSAQKDGLLPLSQTALIAGYSMAYHDYEGIALYEDEKPRLVADLGDKWTMMLRNHGLLTLGKNCADAFLRMYMLEAACMIQVRAQAGGGPLKGVAPKILDGIEQQVEAVTFGQFGMLAWPGLLRRLDRRNPGYRD
ncbi:MAG: class II aldolase/adducin family protein [Panacagrimonas sp.]